MKPDIEIAESIKPLKIKDVAASLGIDESRLFVYGEHIAKVEPKLDGNRGKLVLVTAINPTPMGEGKTTIAIGLADGLKRLGKKSALALREPSLGPVFGVKGGATGGGYSQVLPMADINLHFTGDLHAITSANNLLAAMIDNSLFQGNLLGIDPEKIVFKRAIDMNDRALREIEVNAGTSKMPIKRKAEFVITAACEVMAIFCLAKDMEDLRRRLENIIVAYTFDGRPVYAKELEAVDAMLIILKDAFKPNLVQTLEGTPAFIHGGPFANVAHGCNSVQATLTALNYADIVVTEAGFGAELGAEKFLDIKCRTSGLVPDAAVIVASLRALKYNGGAFKDELTKENFEALNLGVENLVGHIENLKKFGLPVVVALNRFETDSDEEIFFIENICEAYGAKFAVAEGHARGGEGMTKLAEIVIKLCDKEKELKFAYELGDNIKTKIEKLALNIYGASAVEYSAEAEEKIKLYGSLLDNLPVCMAKTQYSFSNNPELLGRPKDFVFHISDIDLRKGAGFVVAISGSMLQMFGLPKVPNAARIKYENGKIYGLY